MVDISALELSNIINGEVQGDPNVRVNTLSKIENGKNGSLSFLSDLKYISFYKDCNASIVILNKSFKNFIEEKKSSTLIWVDDARTCFAAILKFYAESKQIKKTGIHQNSVISKSCDISNGVYIAANVVIGENSKIGDNSKVFENVVIGDNVTIGSNTIIKAGVCIYDDSIIGNNCTIHSGAVIGSDGFGFAPNQENKYDKVYHIGNTILEDHVEIGANTTIDRGTLGSTVIKKGVKLDNLIQIAHNVEIGENTVIAAQTGIAGSTKIGANCMIGGQVGIVGHIEIANEVKIAAQSGISQSIKKVGSIVQGSPAFNIMDYKKSYVLFKNLPSIKRKVDSL